MGGRRNQNTKHRFPQQSFQKSLSLKRLDLSQELYYSLPPSKLCTLWWREKAGQGFTTSGEEVRSNFSNAMVRAEVYQAREVLRPKSERNPEAIFFSPPFFPFLVVVPLSHQWGTLDKVEECDSWGWGGLKAADLCMWLSLICDLDPSIAADPLSPVPLLLGCNHLFSPGTIAASQPPLLWSVDHPQREFLLSVLSPVAFYSLKSLWNRRTGNQNFINRKAGRSLVSLHM